MQRKHERLIASLWFCVRMDWLTKNPAILLRRVKAEPTPTDYFPKDEFKALVDGTYAYGDWRGGHDFEHRRDRLRALILMMRWSGLAIKDARSVNALMTATYWEIGRRIAEFEQSGEQRAEYGEQLIEELARDLTRQFGRGFGRANLWQMRAFYRAWPDQNILQTLSGESGTQQFSSRFPLPWSAYVRLLSVKRPEARSFYETEALRSGWSIRQLNRKIESQFYERIALSKNVRASSFRIFSIMPLGVAFWVVYHLGPARISASLCAEAQFPVWLAAPEGRHSPCGSTCLVRVSNLLLTSSHEPHVLRRRSRLRTHRTDGSDMFDDSPCTLASTTRSQQRFPIQLQFPEGILNSEFAVFTIIHESEAAEATLRIMLFPDLRTHPIGCREILTD